MPRLNQRAIRLLVAGAFLALTASGPGTAAANVLPGHLSSVSVDGVDGVLRAGSPWGPGSSASELFSPIDDEFEPEGQQWNSGSFWWDEDPSVNPAGPVTWTLFLDGPLKLNRFVAQADDNDSYLLEWWDGGAWQTAWNIPAANTFGLVTRDSGLLAPITTDRLRFSATSGDGYYALSELQALAIPEPATWAMLILGFTALGSALRSRRQWLHARRHAT